MPDEPPGRSMRQLEARWWGPALAYASVCAALWPLPVFGLLHAEASAVVAAAAFFIAGLAGVAAFRQLEAVGAVMRRQLILLAVPLGLLTLSLLWRPNCAYPTGLGLFLVLVPPSAVLGVALAYGLTALPLRRPRRWLVGLGLAMAIGGVVADLGFHPQLFTYNHVFGGVLGPIYDEELSLRPGVFAFRALTLLWATGLVLAGHALRTRGAARRTRLRWALGGSALIGATYLLSVPLGIQQSHRALAAALGAHVRAGPFEIYYDPDSLEPEELRRIEDELRYRHRQLEARLEIAPADPIRVYLYPDADTKGALIGSRETSVVPVWLAAPQIHMLAERVPVAAAHELVHVFAREFGMPGLRASPAVGLVEGLAVALEPPDGLPGPTELVLAAQQVSVDAQGLEQDPAAVAQATMDPVGFWTTRAGVAYTASGAFVAWLLDRYGSEPFREAYRTGNVARAYGQPVEALARAWARSLEGQRATPQAVELAEALLTRRSLFERPCPHHVPAFVRDARAGAEALEAGQIQVAREAFASSLRQEPLFDAALAGWARAVGAEGRHVPRDSLLRQEARSLDSLSGAQAAVALADLHRLAGRDADAGRLYAEALARTPGYAPLASSILQVRSRLSSGAVRALLSHPEDPARAALELAGRAPVVEALLWDRAGEPGRAWAVAAAWDLDALAAPPLDRAAWRGLQARLAYWAGEWATAESLALASARGYRQERHPAAAAAAEDWAARARWRRASSSLPRTPSE